VARPRASQRQRHGDPEQARMTSVRRHAFIMALLGRGVAHAAEISGIVTDVQEGDSRIDMLATGNSN